MDPRMSLCRRLSACQPFFGRAQVSGNIATSVCSFKRRLLESGCKSAGAGESVATYVSAYCGATWGTLSVEVDRYRFWDAAPSVDNPETQGWFTRTRPDPDDR